MMKKTEHRSSFRLTKETPNLTLMDELRCEDLIWEENDHDKTRTTRTPAFWDTPRHPVITHTSNSHQTPSQKSKQDKVKATNFKKIAKNSNFKIL